MPELRERLVEACRQRGLSLGQASSGAELERGAISKIVRGNPNTRVVPSSHTCIALAKFFGWPQDEILRLAGHYEPRRLPQDKLVALADHLMREGWPERPRQVLLDVARALDANSAGTDMP